jgi:hypothetical protein
MFDELNTGPASLIFTLTFTVLGLLTHPFVVLPHTEYETGPELRDCLRESDLENGPVLETKLYESTVPDITKLPMVNGTLAHIESPLKDFNICTDGTGLTAILVTADTRLHFVVLLTAVTKNEPVSNTFILVAFVPVFHV